MNICSSNETVANITPGNEVLIYREEKDWYGAYIFLYREGLQSVLLENNDTMLLFHNTMLKMYTSPNVTIKDMLSPIDEDINKPYEILD